MWSILQPRPVQRNQGLSGPPRVSSTQATPALKDVELVEPMMGGMHRGTADWKESGNFLFMAESEPIVLIRFERIETLRCSS